MKFRSLVSAAVLGLVAMVMTAVPSAAAPQPLLADGFLLPVNQILLGCYVTVTQPAPVGTAVARISQVGSVRVNVTARYPSGIQLRTTRGSATGTATVTFSVPRSAKGKSVPVVVQATYGSIGWTCRTSFIAR